MCQYICIAKWNTYNNGEITQIPKKKKSSYKKKGEDEQNSNPNVSKIETNSLPIFNLQPTPLLIFKLPTLQNWLPTLKYGGNPKNGETPLLKIVSHPKNWI